MNILFLSRLSGALYAGPTYSVPRQVEAQSKIDNVFWYNAEVCDNELWDNLSYYHDLKDYPQESIRFLPEPFCHPDIIVIEQFYNWGKSKLLKELLLSDIPFVIIPRGELTKQAQKRKKLKKVIANALVFRKFAQTAASIQFLTVQEYIDSGEKWNTSHFILPNGIDRPDERKKTFSDKEIRCVSIGRIEPFQKGLDLLISACAEIREELKAANCTISIYGPDVDNKKDELAKRLNAEKLDSIITLHDGVFGKEKESVLLSSDVFLLPSRFEGHPMSLIEALSYGLPSIVTTGSNMSEEIKENGAGWTSETSVEGLKQSFSSMLKQKTRFAEIGLNAATLSEFYVWSNLAIVLHDKLDLIIHKHSISH